MRRNTTVKKKVSLIVGQTLNRVRHKAEVLN